MAISYCLRVEVVQAENLVKPDFFGMAGDPQCKVFLDNKQQPHVTKAIRKTQAPVWAELFWFNITSLDQTLYFKVFCRVGLRKKFMGTTSFLLGNFLNPDTLGNTKVYARNLKGREGKNDSVSGKLTVSLTLLHPAAAAAATSVPRTVPSSDLPEGWEERRDYSNRMFYVNHNTRQIQWERPSRSATVSLSAPHPQSTNHELTWAGTPRTHASGRTSATLARHPSMPNPPSHSTVRERRSSSNSSSGHHHRHRSDDTTRYSTPSQLSDSTFIQLSPGEDLPPGWEQRRARDGRIFFIDHNRRKTQWEDPRTGRPVFPITDSGDNSLSAESLGPLPRGWEERRNAAGQPYYVDHVNRRTQWEDPRMTVTIPAADPPKYIRDYQEKHATFRRKLPQVEHRHKFEVRVRRSHVFEDSFEKIADVPADRLVKRLWITFQGEEGLDYGGVAREWFYLLSREIFNPYYCLFEYSASDNYTLQISPNSDVNPEHLRYFHFIGRIMGMAVFNDKFLDAFFIPSFYKRFLGRTLSMDDLASIEPEKYNSLLWMMNNSIKGVLFETFSVEVEKFGEKVVHELKPGGSNIEVTDSNKKEYVDLYLKWRLNYGTETQMNELLRGFYEVIPKDLMAVFDAKELEYLFGGLADLDIDDWQRNTLYKNYEPTDKVIRWFWVCVRGMDREQQARLLQFVTGTSRVPATGFKDLWGSDGPRQFCIEKWGNENNLPRSHTCFNRLDLPPYTTYRQLEDKLQLAIEQTAGFGTE